MNNRKNRGHYLAVHNRSRKRTVHAMPVLSRADRLDEIVEVGMLPLCLEIIGKKSN